MECCLGVGARNLNDNVTCAEVRAGGSGREAENGGQGEAVKVGRAIEGAERRASPLGGRGVYEGSDEAGAVTPGAESAEGGGQGQGPDLLPGRAENMHARGLGSVPRQ